MNFILKICLVFSLSIGVKHSYSQWDLIYINDSLACRDIHFFDEDTGIIIGTHGYNSKDFIMRTNDGGQTWDTSYFNNVMFWSIDFPSRDTGYIAFSNPSQINVLRSIDGGNTWLQTTSNLLVGNTKMSIDFFNNNVGVLSTGGFSWKTIDAGDNWFLGTNDPIGGEDNIFILDSALLGADGSALVYSFDTCNTYNLIVPYANGSASNVFAKEDKICISAIGQSGASYGYAHNNFGIIAIGSLSNMTFNVIHFPYPQMYQIIDVSKTNSFYYAVGYPFNSTIGGHFLKSSDGINWFRQESSEPGGVQISLIERVFCLNDTLCYAYGGGRVYKTTNGGGAMLQQAGVLINGIDEIEKDNLLFVYPNPFSSLITIESQQMIDRIIVRDLVGNIIADYFPLSLQYSFELKVSNGIYIVEIISEGRRQQQKIIKQ